MTSEDAINADVIEGKDKFSLRGKAAKRHKKKNPEPMIINVPKIMLDSVGIARLYADVMHVNGNPFLYDMLEK